MSAEADALVGSVKGAVAGIRSALAAGKELEALGDDIRQLGMADLQARAAYRKRQRQVKGDMVVFSAIEEWRRLKEITDLIEKARRDIIAAHGAKAWAEIERIRDRLNKEAVDEVDEFGRDIAKLRALKWWCTAAAAFVTYLLWLGGFL